MASGRENQRLADLNWITEILKTYFDTRIENLYRLFEERKHMLDERHATQVRSVESALAATEKRFESVNEFRAQLVDQARTFMPRIEAEQRTQQNAERINDLIERIAAINTRMDTAEGRSGGHADSTRNIVIIATLAFTLIGLITGAVGLYLSFHH